ncbi:hypothetical protein FHU35_13101 [Saccharopolyspora dendranthemae]|uniref:Uncharacterized protein n=1 Tax=Saccharopolyspora dendranthemae TaxID=1181886 RepID=A0A561U4V5_9PSEU|nr:hypothetical protein FHU35_13101 [Saccharopolyspora dendranthemae]
MSLKYCPACHCDKWLYRHTHDQFCKDRSWLVVL